MRIHARADHPGGLLHGFQLWVNLPAAHKMDAPRYQDVPARAIPEFDAAPGVRAKVIAGECAGVKAVVQTLVPVQYIDFVAQPGASFTHAVPAAMSTVFCYVYSGEGVFGAEARAAAEGDMMVMTPEGGSLRFSVPEGAQQPLRFLLLAGAPLREPVVRHGPFVMNTRAQIQTAFQEYQNGTFIKHRATMAEFK
jgi:redox-sensitive bicupin YhaK (pirin superfamily)